MALIKKNVLPDIKLYNRKTKALENEVIFEKNLMEFFYSTRVGDIINRTILPRKFLTSLYGFYQDSSLSKKDIAKFISKYDFSLNEVERPIESFTSFNDFFYRTLKKNARPIDPSPDEFISPADSKLIVYNADSDKILPVKGVPYTLKQLLRDAELAKEYQNGLCMIFRLAPLDYHRFCYIDKGTHSKITDIKGRYYSVHPYALSANYRVFSENHRHYCTLHTENFGDVIYMEVGATFVGTIVQNNGNGADFIKGEEKGYFKFGGSTVVILVKPNIIDVDNDILEYSKQGIETIVKYGEKIGKKK